MRAPAILILCASGLLAQDAREMLNRGVQAFKGGRYSEAVADFQKAVDLDPSFATARLYLATAWMQQYVPGAESPENLAVFQHADTEFRALLVMEPSNKTVLASLASLYLNAKKWDDARAFYKSLTNADPGDPLAYYSLGFIAWAEWYPAYSGARSGAGLQAADPGPLPDAATRAALRARWWTTLDEGVFNENRALELNPQYSDAMAYLNLLIRERADLRDTKDEYQRDIAEADQWVQKALAAKKAQSSGMGIAAPPPPPPPPPPAPPGAPGVGRIMVGAGVQSSQLISQTPPVYPPLARQARIQGTVRISMIIDRQGHVSNLTLISGHPLLVEAAINAVRQWVYQPTLLNGEPVEVSTTVDVNFTLNQ